jgi:hypothetical protein
MCYPDFSNFVEILTITNAYNIYFICHNFSPIGGSFSLYEPIRLGLYKILAQNYRIILPTGYFFLVMDIGLFNNPVSLLLRLPKIRYNQKY